MLLALLVQMVSIQLGNQLLLAQLAMEIALDVHQLLLVMVVLVVISRLQLEQLVQIVMQEELKLVPKLRMQKLAWMDMVLKNTEFASNAIQLITVRLALNIRNVQLVKQVSEFKLQQLLLKL